MAAANRLRGALILGVALLASSCQSNNPQAFSDAVRRADGVVLYEGLPHQMYEAHLLEEERRSKPVHDLDGYPFYQEPLKLTAEDANRLSEVLGESATYKPFSGEKKCGGFHPDYAVEWQVGANRYRALICLGCHEAKLFGPGLESRNDLDRAAYEKLQKLLNSYRKNRPASKSLE
jgi:hypothetical protein